EHFCRRLAEKELCPNLLPQTGPTGGGDSKVDTETFPVADTIAERWYEGDPKRAARERWAFAFSAKKKWRPKVKDDVRKIVETGREYSLIYFMTNQAVRDRDRAAVEDALRKQWGIEIRILDCSWIVDKVAQNNRWDVVYQTLDIQHPCVESKSMPGPLDAERQRNFEELELLIQDSARYQGSEYQLAEDCLQTALLARGLGRPRIEIDGRFDRAERIARNQGNMRQLFRILYQRAWTANWWFDDFTELDRLYKIAEPLVIDTEVVWDLWKLVNLWQVGTTWRQAKPTLNDHEDWASHSTKLREALQRHAADLTKPTSALWARTELVLMDLTEAVIHRERLPSLLTSISGILKDADKHAGYPVEPIVQIIQELGRAVGGDETYDGLIEEVIQFQAKRVSKAEQGRIRLRRGSQKLEAGKTYDAIDQFAKAQNLLAQEEHKSEFVRALAGTALGYEAAGLLWAARANLIVALDRTLYEFYQDGQIPPQALPLLRKLVWVELQLGRIPCVLIWVEWLGLVSHALKLDGVDRKKIEEEFYLMDRILGILILRTRYEDWSSLDRVAGLLERFSLLMSRGAALFSLGYEDKFRSEYKETGDLDQFFSLWLNQPAADDLPTEAQWLLRGTVAMRTSILGSEIELVAENHTTSILLGEAILAFLEAFLSTVIKLRGHYSARPYLRIEIRQSGNGTIPFIYEVEEDECGETKIIITHPRVSASILVQDSGYQEALIRLLAEFIRQLQITFSLESLEGLFAKDRAQDRAFLTSLSPIALTNVLTDNPKYHIGDWMDESLTESLVPLRTTPWKATTKPDTSTDKKIAALLAFADGPPPAGLFGVDGLKHRDLQILSPINMALWDKAHWRGLGFAVLPGNPPIPELILIFEDQEAGAKIFRGWQKRLGEADQDEWIGLTLITGIDSSYPSYYLLAIGVNEEYFTHMNKPKGPFALVYRMQDMTPVDSINIDRFLFFYRKAGRYRLTYNLFAPTQPISPYANNIFFEKRRLRIV
ncbi:MAG: hypothetical protein KAV87_05270, partial [Desulfobacteraceae bacterium]|nr:hypothetical protein [Desulfobacteraceae bacterium]